MLGSPHLPSLAFLLSGNVSSPPFFSLFYFILSGLLDTSLQFPFEFFLVGDASEVLFLILPHFFVA